LSEIPVVVITAREHSDEMDGVTLVLRKPLDMDRLLTEVGRHCSVKDLV
jgi:hypothetical protein